MKIHPLLIPFTSLAIASPLFSAVGIPLSPVADAFVNSANPTANYGGAGAISISAAGLPKGEQQALLMFNFFPAKTLFDATYGTGEWVVDSISLQLAAANPGNAVFNSPSAPGSIAVRWFNDDSWTEGIGTPASVGASGVNFNSLEGLLESGNEDSGSLAFAGGTSGFNFISLSSAGLLAEIMAGGTSSLNLHAKDAAVAAVFNSRNFSNSTNWPLLTLTASAVPEPSIGILTIVVLAITLSQRQR